MLRLEHVGHQLGASPLVEAKLDAGGGVQIEATGEGANIGQLFRGKRGDRAGIHAARQVGADIDIADQLPVDGLAEQAIEFLDTFLLIDRVVGFAEAKIPISLCRGHP